RTARGLFTIKHSVKVNPRRSFSAVLFKLRIGVKMKVVSSIQLTAACLIAVATASASPAPTNQVSLLGLPLSFEANRGQSDPSVKFVSRGDGYDLSLTQDGAVIRFQTGFQTRETRVVRMKLTGASAGARVSGAESLPGKVNYFIGNDPKRWI